MAKRTQINYYKRFYKYKELLAIYSLHILIAPVNRIAGDLWKYQKLTKISAINASNIDYLIDSIDECCRLEY